MNFHFKNKCKNLAFHEGVPRFGGSIADWRVFAGGGTAEAALGRRRRRWRPFTQFGVEVLQRLVRQTRLPFGPHGQWLLQLFVGPVFLVVLNWQIHDLGLCFWFFGVFWNIFLLINCLINWLINWGEFFGGLALDQQWQRATMSSVEFNWNKKKWNN